MKRPELKTCVITPNPVNSRAALTITIAVEDEDIVFGTEYSYARDSNKAEVYAGEESVLEWQLQKSE